MKPIQGYDLVNEAGEFKRLPAGIYGVRITNVVDNPENEFLEIYVDITKGEYANYFKTQVDNGLKDSSKTIRSYKTNALPFFKAFITAVEKTNTGYKWDWDEKKLIGKNVIAVFGEEEYINKNNELKVATVISEFRSLEAYQKGDIKVPELKKLSPNSGAPASPAVPTSGNNTEVVKISDLDLPF